jgi:hypothetical protein
MQIVGEYKELQQSICILTSTAVNHLRHNVGRKGGHAKRVPEERNKSHGNKIHPFQIVVLTNTHCIHLFVLADVDKSSLFHLSKL